MKKKKPSAGDVFMSIFGTNLRLTVVSTKDQLIVVEVERKLLDKKTGEVKIETRTREVPHSRWDHALIGYMPAP